MQHTLKNNLQAIIRFLKLRRKDGLHKVIHIVLTAFFGMIFPFRSVTGLKSTTEDQFCRQLRSLDQIKTLQQLQNGLKVAFCQSLIGKTNPANFSGWVGWAIQVRPGCRIQRHTGTLRDQMRGKIVRMRAEHGGFVLPAPAQIQQRPHIHDHPQLAGHQTIKLPAG